MKTFAVALACLLSVPASAIIETRVILVPKHDQGARQEGAQDPADGEMLKRHDVRRYHRAGARWREFNVIRREMPAP